MATQRKSINEKISTAKKISKGQLKTNLKGGTKVKKSK